MKFRFFLILCQFFTLNIYANWFGGGVISVQNLGPDSFEVVLNLSTDCASNWNDSTVLVEAKSSCGQAFSFSLDLKLVSYQAYQWYNPCSKIKNTCNDPSAKRIGIKKFHFSNTVLLKPACESWSISYNKASIRRKLDNTNDSSVFIRTTLNTLDFPTNSTPERTTFSMANYCKDYIVSYNMGVTDPDGDSLSYEFVGLQKDSGNFVNYHPGFTGEEPIPGIVMDSVTGQINFLSTSLKDYGIALKVREYSYPSREFKAETILEHHFYGEDCSNTRPYDTLGIRNFQGDGRLSSGNVIEDLCPGDSFSFDVLIWDPGVFYLDLFDTLLITSNVQGVLPYSSFEIKPVNDSFHIVSIAWRVISTGTQSQSFFIQTSDDACPIPGYTTSSYTVKVNSKLVASPDSNICRGDTLTFADVGAGALTWKALYGDSLIPGQNFSCDSACQRAKLWPQNTTLYAVEGDLQNGCLHRDTFKIIVADDFELIAKPDFEFCAGVDSVDLWVKAIPDNVNYSYSWPNAYDSSSTRAKLYRTWSSNDFTVRVRNDSGCLKRATVRATRSPVYPEIEGADKSFRNNTESYRALGKPGSSFSWTSEGASIDSAIGDRVFIRFKDTSVARIGVIETDTGGCESRLLWKEIQLVFLGMNEANDVFRVYPNPAVDRVFVESSQALSKLRVYNVRGELLEEHQPKTGYYQLNIAPYAAGVYFLYVETKDDFKSFRLQKHQ